MRVRRTTLALLALLGGAAGVGAAACGRTGATRAVGGTPTPITSLPVPQDFGSGGDGDLGAGQPIPSDCHLLVTGTGDSVSWTGPWGSLHAGDRVLLLQVQDAAILGSGTSGVGGTLAASAIGNAGRWEIATVASLPGGSTFVATAPLLHAYGSDGGRRHAEACRAPQLANAIVDQFQQIVAKPWDGNTGGVIAFYVASSLQLAVAGAIDASGDGFHGGLRSTKDVGSVDIIAEDYASGGGRGEGLDAGGFDPPSFGRGNFGNGGGGGNPRSAGGGGGGNAGMGGAGGMENENAGSDSETRGRGGQAISAAPGDRLLFGGGGGGGQQGADNGGAGNGAPGGGVIVIFARRIAGGGSVVAGGKAGQAGSADGQGNGGGGGGAGGTILVQSSSGAIAGIYALGGAGGDAQETGERNGPGGGGGGGSIAVFGPKGTLDASGGDPGVSHVGGLPTYGATTGGIGRTN